MHSILFVLEGITIGGSSHRCSGVLVKNDRHLLIGDRETEFEDRHELLICLCQCVETFSTDLAMLDLVMPIQGTEIYSELRNIYDGYMLFCTDVPYDIEITRSQKNHLRNTYISPKPFESGD